MRRSAAVATALADSFTPEELERLQRVDHRHLSRLVLFAVLYALGAAAAIALAGRGPQGGFGLLLRLPFYLLAAASLHGVSLFTHEGVHGMLCRGRGWNRALSMVCATPVLQNFAAYRVLHLQHHADLGGGRDPDHYRNYSHRPWLVRWMNAGRLLAGYPAYITMIPVLAWRRATGVERAWIAIEVGVAGALALGVFFSSIPPAVLIHGWLIPMILINTLVNVRGMSQHTLLPEADHPVRGTRTILTSRLVAFFMCNENFHLEHHLQPRVPWSHLPRVHERLRPLLIAEGAHFIPSYFSFVKQFVRQQLRITQPQELALVGLGACTCLALTIRAGPFHPESLRVAGATALYGCAAAALSQASGEWGRKARLAVAYPFSLWFYTEVQRISPALGLPLQDGALLAADRALFGETPALLLSPLASPAWTDVMSALYLSYQFYLHLALGWALLRPVQHTQRLFTPVFTLFALGMAGYLLVPAVGPGRGFAQLFGAPLTGGALTAATAWVVARGSSLYDVFPSLHVAVTGVLLAHDAGHLRWRFRLMLPVAFGLVVATVYLRYHYAVDLVAGGALAAAVVSATRADTPQARNPTG